MADLDCSTDSVLGMGVSITFGVLYGLMLVVVSLYSYYFLMKYSNKFMFSWCGKKFKFWLMDVYKRRRCYVPIITHLTDKITDIAVVIEFAQLAANTTKAKCGINMNYLLALSIFVLVLYSSISSFLIYQTTKSPVRLIMQFLDFELFRTLYVNYLCDKDEPCSPQRWITSLEAAFESTPQALIQTIFLIKTQSFSDSPIVTASLVFSLWSIISKITSDDKVISDADAKHLSFNSKSCKSLTCISWTFVLRYLWRIGDVSSRILITSLLWSILGGVSLSIILAAESIIILYIAIHTKRVEFLFGIVATVVSKSSPQAKRISRVLIIYRCVSNMIFMSIVTFILYSTKECWKCSTYEERKVYLSSDSAIVPILIYSWIVVVCTPFLSMYLTNKIFIGEKSTARNMKDMITSRDWNGILEMQAYKGVYRVYNHETNENLLMLAIQCHYGKLVSHIVSGDRVNLQQKALNGDTILDYIKLTVDPDNKHNDKNKEVNKKYIAELLISIANRCPNMTTNDENGNVLYIACYIGDIESYQSLLEMNKFDASNAWQFAIDGDQPAMVQYLLSTRQRNNSNVFTQNVSIPNYANLEEPNAFAERMIVRKKMMILHFVLHKNRNIDQKRIWFYAVNNGDVKALKTAKPHINLVNTVTTDNKGCTVLHIACQKGEQRDMNMINYLRTVIDVNIRDDRGKIAEDYLNMMPVEEGAEYKMLPLGAKTSNKSALNIQYITDNWESDYDPTIQDSYKKEVMIDNHRCLINIRDTAGQEQFSSMEDQWIRDSQIYILVYSITDRSSLKEAVDCRQRIQRTLDLEEGEYVPIVLVGNNCHLEDQRVVSTEEGHEIVKKWGKDQHVFLEASAKGKINVERLFEEGVRLYWKINGLE